MDKTTQTIARFAATAKFEALTSGEIRALTRHHLDAIGCAAGALGSAPARIARRLAAEAEQPKGCSTFGHSARTSPEYAVFANAAAIRNMDFSDTYLGASGGGGHPSDMTAAILAAVELAGGGGRALLLGLHIAYEIYGAIADAVHLREKGIDQGVFVSVGAAASCARMLGLDEAGMANAVGMALTPSTPGRVTRAGELSHWKGCATGHAAMTALFAARLAKMGMTGPGEPFSGVDGFFRLAREEFDLSRVGQPIDGKSVAERTSLKYFPAEFNAQGPITLLLDLRRRFSVDELESLEIACNHRTWHEIGGGQGDRAEKWNPKTRESADHSLAYTAAVALADGQITDDSFAEQRLGDPVLRTLMDKIDVVERPELTAYWEKTIGESRANLRIELKDGRTIEETVTNYRGHFANPMDDGEVQFKFDSMVNKVMPKADAKRLSDMLWAIDRQQTLDELTTLLRAWTPRSEHGR